MIISEVLESNLSLGAKTFTYKALVRNSVDRVDFKVMYSAIAAAKKQLNATLGECGLMTMSPKAATQSHMDGSLLTVYLDGKVYSAEELFASDETACEAASDSSS